MSWGLAQGELKLVEQASLAFRANKNSFSPKALLNAHYESYSQYQTARAKSQAISTDYYVNGLQLPKTLKREYGHWKNEARQWQQLAYEIANFRIKKGQLKKKSSFKTLRRVAIAHRNKQSF